MPKHHILIVSADQEFEDLCRQALSHFVNITRVTTGAKGLGEFDQNGHYCIVFVDFKLPDMTGIAFIEKITSLSQCIIVLTAVHREVIYALEWANMNHIFRVLPKPCQKDSLSISLQDALNYYMLIERKKQIEDKLLYFSITDPLTGCFGRAYLNDRLPEEMSKSYRYNRDLAILLCDIDKISSINSMYGNWAGDQVLIKFVECAKNILRKNIDLVYRFSKDRFLVVLPETNLDNAVLVAERLRYASSSIAFSSDTKAIHFTVSFGVSSYDMNNYDVVASPDVLLELAERSLLKAKEYGGNTVMYS